MLKKLLIFIILFSTISVVTADNLDYVTKSMTSSTLINVTSQSYSDYYNNATNLTSSTKDGNFIIYLNIEAKTNFTGRALNARIMNESGEVANFNVTSVNSWQAVSMIYPVQVNAGNHNFSVFFKADAGSIPQIRKISFSTIFQTNTNLTTISVSGVNIDNINASNITTGTLPKERYLNTVNSSAQINENQVTNLITDLLAKLNITIFQSRSDSFNSTFEELRINDTSINSTISVLELNEVSDRSYLNNSFPGSSNIVTVGTISSGVWEGTPIDDARISSSGNWNQKPNLTDVNTSAQIDEDQVTNLLTDLGTKLNISIFEILNTTVNGNLDNWNQTYNSTYDSKTTLDEVNSSAQLSGTSQVTSLDTALSGKEPTISTGTADYYWNGTKQFVQIVAAHISDFVTTVRTSFSSTSGLVQYDSGTGVLSDIINQSADIQNINASNLSTGTIPTARYDNNVLDRGFNVLVDEQGSVITTGEKANVSYTSFGTITRIKLSPDVEGSVNISLLNYSNDITGGNYVVMTNQTSYIDTTLSGWNTTVTPDENFRIIINEAVNITRLTIAISVRTT